MGKGKSFLEMILGPGPIEEFRQLPLESFQGREIYTKTDAYTVREEDDLKTVIPKLMDQSNRLFTVAVMDENNKLKGILHMRDVLRWIYEQPNNSSRRDIWELTDISVKEVVKMRPSYPDYPRVNIDGTIDDAIAVMKTYLCLSVPVIGKNGEYCGFISKFGPGSILKACAEYMRKK